MERKMTSSMPDSLTANSLGIEYTDKKQWMEDFKTFLEKKKISSNSAWKEALSLLVEDPHYKTFCHLAERKQVFNAYKMQKLKVEREGHRQRAQKARQELEDFLLNNNRVYSSTKYYQCEEMFADLEVWKNVLEDIDRRDIYKDAMFNLEKREKEEQKFLKKHNMVRLKQVLAAMTNVDHTTTWQDAQQMLLDNPTFTSDTNLLAMDKEDALIVFEEHIRQLEKMEKTRVEVKKKRSKRIRRKNRDAFVILLDELHEQGRITCMSLWVELYPAISKDLRFSAMLGQRGSTPLDLFKFYVKDIKSRFHNEKKIIKKILRQKGLNFKRNTSFEEFSETVYGDSRSAGLDAGNVNLSYSALLEKKLCSCWISKMVTEEYKTSGNKWINSPTAKTQHLTVPMTTSEEQAAPLYEEGIHKLVCHYDKWLNKN